MVITLMDSSASCGSGALFSCLLGPCFHPDDFCLDIICSSHLVVVTCLPNDWVCGRGSLCESELHPPSHIANGGAGQRLPRRSRSRRVEERQIYPRTFWILYHICVLSSKNLNQLIKYMKWRMFISSAHICTVTSSVPEALIKARDTARSKVWPLPTSCPQPGAARCDKQLRPMRWWGRAQHKLCVPFLGVGYLASALPVPTT